MGLQCHPEVTADLLGTWFECLGPDRVDLEHHVERLCRRADANTAEAHALFDMVWSQMTRVPAPAVALL